MCKIHVGIADEMEKDFTKEDYSSEETAQQPIQCADSSGQRDGGCRASNFSLKVQEQQMKEEKHTKQTNERERQSSCCNNDICDHKQIFVLAKVQCIVCLVVFFNETLSFYFILFYFIPVGCGEHLLNEKTFIRNSYLLNDILLLLNDIFLYFKCSYLL